jgi:hypothetical protein
MRRDRGRPEASTAITLNRAELKPTASTETSGDLDTAAATASLITPTTAREPG